MSELHDLEREFQDIVRQAPMDDAPRDVHRDRLREQMLARFDEARQPAIVPTRLAAIVNQGREIMRRPTARLIVTAAACVAILAAWFLIPGQQSTAQAFNMFAEAILAAKSATFQMEVNVEGQAKQTLESSYLAPGKMRSEMQGVVTIADVKHGKFLTLRPKEKLAYVMNAKNMSQDPKKPQFNDIFEQMQDLLSKKRDAEGDDCTPLGEKMIDGRRALGFRCDTPLHVLTLWGDPETGLPVLIESVWSGIPHTEVTMSHFALNAELKPELFDTTPPPGYKTQEFEFDASKPTEAAFIEALRMAADLNDSRFVDSLGAASIQALIIKKALTAKQEENKDLTNELMQAALKMGRGMMFSLELPASADAHYAGKGVKLNEPDRPIFWYKPEGAQTYRVVYADLSVKEAEQAPDVPGAVHVEKTSPAKQPDKQ